MNPQITQFINQLKPMFSGADPRVEELKRVLSSDFSFSADHPAITSLDPFHSTSAQQISFQKYAEELDKNGVTFEGSGIDVSSIPFEFNDNANVADSGVDGSMPDWVNEGIPDELMAMYSQESHIYHTPEELAEIESAKKNGIQDSSKMTKAQANEFFNEMRSESFLDEQVFEKDPTETMSPESPVEAPEMPKDSVKEGAVEDIPKAESFIAPEIEQAEVDKQAADAKEEAPKQEMLEDIELSDREMDENERTRLEAAVNEFQKRFSADEAVSVDIFRGELEEQGVHSTMDCFKPINNFLKGREVITPRDINSAVSELFQIKAPAPEPGPAGQKDNEKNKEQSVANNSGGSAGMGFGDISKPLRGMFKLAMIPASSIPAGARKGFKHMQERREKKNQALAENVGGLTEKNNSLAKEISSLHAAYKNPDASLSDRREATVKLGEKINEAKTHISAIDKSLENKLLKLPDRNSGGLEVGKNLEKSLEKLSSSMGEIKPSSKDIKSFKSLKEGVESTKAAIDNVTKGVQELLKMLVNKLSMGVSKQSGPSGP